MFFRGRGKEISRRGIALFVNADIDAIWQSNNDKFILPEQFPSIRNHLLIYFGEMCIDNKLAHQMKWI